MGAIRVVRARDVSVASASVSTEKWARRVIEVDERLAIALARNEPGALSRWHHHGESTGCVYVLAGRLRIEWGPGGRETTDLEAGDFYVVSPSTIHREQNPGSEDQVLIAFLAGAAPRFVNVDGPERERGAPHGSIRVARGSALAAGPSSQRMSRSTSEMGELVSAGAARSAPWTGSGWHHHGARTTYAYVARGQARVDWGPGGRESVDLAAGDFYVAAPGTIHREANPGSEEQLIVGFHVGPGPIVVDVEAPEPD